MALTLNLSDIAYLCQQTPTALAAHPERPGFETVMHVPQPIGQGYIASTELLPGVRLSFVDCQFAQDCTLATPSHPHPLQIMVYLAGFTDYNAVHPRLGETCGYFSGSGLSPAYATQYRGQGRLMRVDIEMTPTAVESWLTDEQRQSETVQQLFKPNDWKTAFYPQVTPAMRSIAEQLWTSPYQGAAQQMYLQAKVFELLALHLDWMTTKPQQPSGLKPDTVNRLHHARELLNQAFENPPLLTQLAQDVGLSDRTLRRGFRELFGTTVIGYLTQQRINQAQQLLREQKWTVAEVARMVGYAHLGHFAATFKRHCGITPRECLLGKKSVFGS
ncbi:MAG: AraC family transcriptional regulator [Cyanobacteria bacterium P01_G01_bin.54]